jgi:hypothetical protein
MEEAEWTHIEIGREKGGITFSQYDRFNLRTDVITITREQALILAVEIQNIKV